jgi:hypothetical protein
MLSYLSVKTQPQSKLKIDNIRKRRLPLRDSLTTSLDYIRLVNVIPKRFCENEMSTTCTKVCFKTEKRHEQSLAGS